MSLYHHYSFNPRPDSHLTTDKLWKINPVTALFIHSEKTTKTDQCKMVSTSIASKLFNMINEYDYMDLISHLAIGDVLPQQTYPLTPLSQKYWMDTRDVIMKRGKIQISCLTCSDHLTIMIH